MKNRSFECLKAVNNRLHNKIALQDEYQSYLKRIDNIVDRRLHFDESPQFYMTFLKKTKEIVKSHRQFEQSSRIVLENKHLLTKILENRSRKFEGPAQSYHINVHEKRNREIEKINDENKKIAKRITDQYSTIKKALTSNKLNKTVKNQSPDKRTSYHGWNYSPLKPRKLPKLVNLEHSLKVSSTSEAFD